MSSPKKHKPAAKSRKRAAKAARHKRDKKKPTSSLFIERLFRLSPVSPAWTGLLFVICSIALLSMAEIVTGRASLIFDPRNFDPEGPSGGYLWVLLHILLLAYTPTALVVLIREARLNAQLLTGLVAKNDEVRTLLARVGTYPKLGYWISGLTGLVIAIFAPYWDVEVWREHLFSPYDILNNSPEVWAQRTMAPIFGFFAGIMPFAGLIEGHRFNRLARHVTDASVLEKASLVPFTRQGLSNVLIISGWPAIMSLFLFNMGLVYMVVSVSIWALALAIAGLIWPLVGIHNRIKAAKEEQIDWVNRKLIEEKTNLRRGRDTNFSELMSYRAYIESVRQWPLDGSTISRLAFYLAIPLISWSGAAMVERMIDSALG